MECKVNWFPSVLPAICRRVKHLILQVGNETNYILCKLCFAGILDFKLFQHTVIQFEGAINFYNLILLKFWPSRIIGQKIHWELEGYPQVKVATH